MAIKKIITGNINSGKTTYVVNFIKNNLGIYKIGGYITYKIEKNEKKIIYIKDISTNRNNIIAISNIKERPKANIEIFDNFAVNIIKRVNKYYNLLLIDEIGFLELDAKYFFLQLRNAIKKAQNFILVIRKDILKFILIELGLFKYPIIDLDVKKL